MRQQDVVGALLAGGFGIPAQDARLREALLHIGFHLLGAGAELADLVAAAVRAFAGHLAAVTAGVADQRASALAWIGEREIAARAAQASTAVAAEDVGGGAAPVEEQDGLLAARPAILPGPARSARLKIERLPSFSSWRMSTTWTGGSGRAGGHRPRLGRAGMGLPETAPSGLATAWRCARMRSGRRSTGQSHALGAVQQVHIRGGRAQQGHRAASCGHRQARPARRGNAAGNSSW